MYFFATQISVELNTLNKFWNFHFKNSYSIWQKVMEFRDSFCDMTVESNYNFVIEDIIRPCHLLLGQSAAHNNVGSALCHVWKNTIVRLIQLNQQLWTYYSLVFLVISYLLSYKFQFIQKVRKLKKRQNVIHHMVVTDVMQSAMSPKAITSWLWPLQIWGCIILNVSLCFLHFKILILLVLFFSLELWTGRPQTTAAKKATYMYMYLD